jgi:hypothetical protein
LPASNDAVNFGACFDVSMSKPSISKIMDIKTTCKGSCKVWTPANRQHHWSHFLPHVFTATNINITVCGLPCFYPEDGA